MRGSSGGEEEEEEAAAAIMGWIARCCVRVTANMARERVEGSGYACIAMLYTFPWAGAWISFPCSQYIPKIQTSVSLISG
jgi:hypothetical protein